jgi:hypothetical protein
MGNMPFVIWLLGYWFIMEASCFLRNVGECCGWLEKIPDGVRLFSALVSIGIWIYVGTLLYRG